MSASAVGPRCPLFFRPRIFAGAARVRIAICWRVYSRERDCNVVCAMALGLADWMC